jgi:DNA-binding transcriptional ArsR family regulator
MSLGVPTRTASLRACAHPVRLRILSLLTGCAMSAAEIARELDLSHANASYHVRQLVAAGLLDLTEERQVRGGREKRYRHPGTVEGAPLGTDGELQAWHRALADELVRRSAGAQEGARTSADADLWVDPELWEATVSRVRAAMTELHAGARPPRAEGTQRVSATVALFGLRP